MFTKMYQSVSNVQVDDIEYFMILSNLYNILRCYSAILNPTITHETETTKNILLQNYKVYVAYLATLVKKITGLHLGTIEQALI